MWRGGCYWRFDRIYLKETSINLDSRQFFLVHSTGCHIEKTLLNIELCAAINFTFCDGERKNLQMAVSTAQVFIMLTIPDVQKSRFHKLCMNGGGGGNSTKFYTGGLCPKVQPLQPLTHLNTMFD